MQPHLKRTWCIPVITAAFLACMERILWLYAQVYDALYPVVCFDERPCFLIGDKIEPLAMQSGQVAREHYGYEKNGACALLAAIEPLTGKRLAQVHDRRTQQEYALFMRDLAAAYPHAKKIRLVQDNLNTHNLSAFYTAFDAQEAFELAQRFEFYYTPKGASWLNMIEIEFSALARQCLNRRIPTKEALEKQVLAIVKERSDKQIKINWQFSIEAARDKLNKGYCAVQPHNQKYKIT